MMLLEDTDLETMKRDHNSKKFELNGGFAAGTLVHTKEGLVPIEKIKIGDWVLSKPENGGEQAYKPIVKIFAHESATVMKVCGEIPDRPNAFERIVSTLDHQFWVVGQKWTEADDLPKGRFTNGEQFELHDGRHVAIGGCGAIFVSDSPGVGWMPSYMGDLTRPGILRDFVNDKLISPQAMAIERIQALEKDHPLNSQIALEEAEKSDLNYPYLKLPVFDLEVEDFHTYYVGEMGIWVRQTDRGG
ncbi:polymorphic toxin-type HINT domain-containing protein [Undibacterium cyanobacteriorum]|uniref:Polymorphic toxin-type HINT domain-containing protein n=1 Tax=Undibacterium cyanobacteriorum TaxID=3073561 RepID=A0ABY9RI46_9BURK|nr:polymorphic toxin-type HINT domain-containing protein [Undibacterium sp. 20NA77.5]WMW80888.1 polymorphic toxin-type HINT domain-containing protein [Undibacterium sp. 20NA77.5]